MEKATTPRASNSSPTKSPTTKRLRDITKRSGRRLVEYFVIVSSLPRCATAATPDKDGEDDGNDTSSIVNFESAPYSPSRRYRSHKAFASPSRRGDQQQEEEQQVAGTMEWVLKKDVNRVGGAEEEEESLFLYDKDDFEPVITARYPLEDHEGNPLHESVTSFCHPRGHIRLRDESSMPKVHYFVATGGRGQQMYGTCLTLYEPYLIYEKNSNNKKEVYLPKCLTILSTYPYLVAFREYLTQLHRLTKMGDMPLPIERYISNFCAEIPAPPPGSFEVQTTILDSVIKFWSPPHNQPIAWVSLPFSHLFECLEIDNIITIWHALALERQVLLTSSQLSLLTTCSEILISLLFPMRWSHAYIPVLPHFLIPILSAPMPYLCGVDRSNLPAVLMELSPSAIIVDLDKNLVNIGPATPPLPPLPRSYETTLQAKLNENAGMIFREARSLTKNDDCSESGRHLPIHVKLMADAMWESRLCLFDEAFHLAFTPEAARTNLLNGNDNSALEERDLNDPTAPLRIMTPAEKQNLRKQSQWDAVQEAFLNAYVHILRNYRKFLVFPSKDNDTGSLYGGAGFRTTEFVNSQLFDMQEFLKQLLDTQMFDDFITKRLYGSGEADVTFFDMAVDEFHKNNNLKDIVGSNVSSGIRRAGSVATNVVIGADAALSPSESAKRHKPMRGLRRAFSRNRHNNDSTRRRSGKAPGPATPRNKNANPSTPGKKNVQEASAEPLLQSARVHRKLKTIVPPEPSCIDLPARLVENTQTNETSALTQGALMDDGDNLSVGSNSTSGTRGTGKNYDMSSIRSGGADRSFATPGSPPSAASKSSSTKYKRRQDRLAEAMERERKLCYTYPIFPSALDDSLFGETRPMSQAVLAEFDRQRENAARFRRKASMEGDEDGSGKGVGVEGLFGKGAADKRQHSRNISGTFHAPQDDPHSAEVATFTVFFMFFTSVVGRELLEMSSDASLRKIDDRTILSTYSPAPTSPELPPSEIVSKNTEQLDNDEDDAKEEESKESGEFGAIENHKEAKDATEDNEEKNENGDEAKEESVRNEETENSDDKGGKLEQDVNVSKTDHEDKDLEKEVDADDEEGKGASDSDKNSKDEEPTESSVDVDGDGSKDKESTDATKEQENASESEDIKEPDNENDEDQVKESTESEDLAASKEQEDSTENPKVDASEENEEEEEEEEEVASNTEQSQKDADATIEDNVKTDPVQKSTDDLTVDTVPASSDISVGTGKVSRMSDDVSLDVGNSHNDRHDESKEKAIVPKTPPRKVIDEAPRRRFRDALSTLQIMEAKETAKAQLGLAFEMLTIMKKRELKADPEAYQCLIDACGRCGDTERATQLLGRMHEDGIVADGVVYACLVSAFSAENAWRKLMGKTDEELPDWANGASVEMDWNKLQKKRGVLEIAKEGLSSIARGAEGENEHIRPSNTHASDSERNSRHNSMKGIRGILSRRRGAAEKTKKRAAQDKEAALAALSNVSAVENTREAFVTEPVLRQILLGENLLELVYPDISIDTDDELCPRCNAYMNDDEVVAGWSPNDPQDYTTKCPHCMMKFVPHFCVQSTSPTFVGSRGPASPLLCQRLSPWVLQKELRSVMGDREGIEDLLSPEWREKENKNAVLWWNLVLSFMRYRFPFTFLLQGSFETNLIAPTPDDESS